MLSHLYFKGLIYCSSIINSKTTYIPLTYAATTQKPTILKHINKIHYQLYLMKISYTNFAERNFISFRIIYKNTPNWKKLQKSLQRLLVNFLLLDRWFSQSAWREGRRDLHFLGQNSRGGGYEKRYREPRGTWRSGTSELFRNPLSD